MPIGVLYPEERSPLRLGRGGVEPRLLSERSMDAWRWKRWEEASRGRECRLDTEVFRERGVWPITSKPEGGVLPVMLEDSESVRRRADRLEERRLGMVIGCEGERMSRGA